MAGISTVSVGAVYFFGRIFKTENDTNKVVEQSQLALAAAIGLNGLGGLGLYKLYQLGIPYDKIMHFVVPLILFMTGISLLKYRFSKTKKTAVIIMALLIFSGSLLWEGIEVLQDRVFGTKTAGVYGEDYEQDTILDIVSDVCGISLAVYLTLRSRKNTNEMI